MGRGVVAPFLWNRGIRTIDHVIGTHPQLDHVGGLAWVVRHFIVKNYWGSGETREESFYRRLQQSLADRGLQERWPEKDRRSCHPVPVGWLSSTHQRASIVMCCFTIAV